MAAQITLAEGGGKIRPKNLASDFADIESTEVLQRKERGERRTRELFAEVEANILDRKGDLSTKSGRRKCQSTQAAARAAEHDTRRKNAAHSLVLLPQDDIESKQLQGKRGKQEKSVRGKPPKSPVKKAIVKEATYEDKRQAGTGGELQSQKKDKGMDLQSDSEKEDLLSSVEKRMRSVVKWERAVKDVLGEEERSAPRRAKKRASDEGLREGKRVRLTEACSMQIVPIESQAEDDAAGGAHELQFLPPARGLGFRPQSEALAVYPKIRPSRAALFNGEDTKEWVRKLDDRTVQATAPEGTEAYKRQKKQMSFGGFTRVFGPASTQEDFFRRTTAGPVEAFVAERKSCVVWAFGMTAAGKSHTMIGNEGQPGLIPRSMDLIFALLAQQASTVPISFSVIENQSDKFFDLLATPKFEHNKRLGWLEFNPGSGNVKGATEVVVQSAEQGKAALQRALANRQTERTDLNAASSRSHAVFMLRIGDARTMDTDARARLCFVDLAGSERLGRTHNEGARLTESKWINATLTSIFTCIKVTAENQEAVRKNARAAVDIVPWRNSKISNMFREELQGRGSMILAMCLSPDRDDFDETIYQLERAKEAAKIRILCHVEAIQQPWSVIKAPRATPAVRFEHQEGIGRLCLLEEENERLRHQLTSMSANLAGDDVRVCALEAENERLRHQMTSLSEMLREAEAAKLRVAEQTEMTVRREVVAEFDAALVQRKAAEADRLERALQFERRRFERQLARARANTPASPLARASEATEMEDGMTGQTERLSTASTESVREGECSSPEVSSKGRVSEATEPVQSGSKRETETLEDKWISESDFKFEDKQRTVAKERRTSEEAERTQPLPERKEVEQEKEAALVAWQEKFHQLEEKIAALELGRSTAAIEAEAAVTKNVLLEQECALLKERLEAASSVDTCTAEEERTSDEKQTDLDKASAAREMEERISAELQEARETIAALQEQIAHLGYAMEQHGVLMEEVRREEWAAAEERAAEVVAEYKRDLEKGLEEERSQAETDAHSLTMQIEMLEDQLERQREETDKLNARYQALLSRVQSSPSKPLNPKPFVGFGFAFGASKPLQSPQKASPRAPSHSFSSPLGRAISAAVNKPRVLEEAVNTEGIIAEPMNNAEPIGLGILARDQECEQATKLESPARGKSPSTLTEQSSVVRRSPSFAFLAANRGSLPTPRAYSHRRFVSEINEENDESGSPAYRAAGRHVTSLTEERTRTRVSFDFPMVPGDSHRAENELEKRPCGGSVERQVPADEIAETLEQQRKNFCGASMHADVENELAEDFVLGSDKSAEPQTRQDDVKENEEDFSLIEDEHPDPRELSPNPNASNFSPNPSSSKSNPRRSNPPVVSPEQSFLAFSLRATNPQTFEKSNLSEETELSDKKDCTKVVLDTAREETIVDEGSDPTESKSGLSELKAGQEDKANITEPLSRFQRGKLKAAELFTALKPVTETNALKGAKQDVVKEEGEGSEIGLQKDIEPGPVGLLLQETLRLPLPVLTSAISGNDDGSVKTLVAKNGGSLDVEHFERRGTLRLSKDKKLCMRYCFALLSERWRDPSSEVFFPLEKRKGANLERATSFSAIFGAQTVKAAAAKAREGLRVEGLSKGSGSSSGKENADPCEDKKVKKVEGLPRTRKLTHRKITRSSKQISESDEATLIGSEQGSESPGKEDRERAELSQREALGTPYDYSGFKKVVPIRSVYQRGSRRVQRTGKSKTERAALKLRQEKSGSAKQDLVDLSSSSEEEAGKRAPLEGQLEERETKDQEVPETCTKREEEKPRGLERDEAGATNAAADEGDRRAANSDEKVEKPKAVDAKVKRKRLRLQPMQRVIDLEEALGETDGSPSKETQQKRTRRLASPAARRTRGNLRFLM